LVFYVGSYILPVSCARACWRPSSVVHPHPSPFWFKQAHACVLACPRRATPHVAVAVCTWGPMIAVAELPGVMTAKEQKKLVEKNERQSRLIKVLRNENNTMKNCLNVLTNGIDKYSMKAKQKMTKGQVDARARAVHRKLHLAKEAAKLAEHEKAKADLQKAKDEMYQRWEDRERWSNGEAPRARRGSSGATEMPLAAGYVEKGKRTPDDKEDDSDSFETDSDVEGSDSDDRALIDCDDQGNATTEA